MNAKNQSLDPKKIKTDLVVLGAGGAGLTAAISAAEAGVKVAVVEKQSPGGNSALAGGFFASESKLQKRLMIDARREKMFKMAMDYSHWKINPEIIRAIIYKSADTIEWLEERGVEFEMVFPLYPNQNPLTWHLIRGGGATLIKTLVDKCEDLGIPLLRKTAGKKLLTDSSGKIKGIHISSKGKTFKIKAKAVVIATGGYGANKRLLKKYFPHYVKNMVHLGIASCKGDGLAMAMGAGADTDGLGTVQLHGPYFTGSYDIDSLSRQPNSLWVNRRAERYLDETLTYTWPEAGNALARQPDGLSFTLMDADILSSIIKNGTRTGQLHVAPGTRLINIEKKLKKQVAKGKVTISRSWGKIATWMGVPLKDLKGTVEKYNTACDQGYDGLFGKDRCYLEPIRTPPFYAIQCDPSFLGTIGGIKINHHMEVMNKKSRPIPGLYAAGQDTGGWECDTYNPLLAGMTFGFALNSGRIAGENVTTYVA